MGNTSSLANHLLIAMPSLGDGHFSQTVALVCEHSDRGFVLHRPGGDWDSTHRISDHVQVTTSRDVLAAIARGTGPLDAFVALGYAGWEAGQLEREMLDNAWLSLPVDENIVFGLPFEDRWQAAWQLLGVDSSRVSFIAGHA